MEHEKDYSRQGQAACDKKQRELDRTEQKAEASEAALTKLLSRALKDDKTRANLSRDCLDGFQGRKNNTLEKAGFGALKEGEITGFEVYPWDED